ncbi:MAG: hypothetical protein AAF214_07375 [Pseudomonadota bacterium]
MRRIGLTLALLGVLAGVGFLVEPRNVRGQGQSERDDLAAPATLDQALGRPIVIYFEGILPDGLAGHLRALDQGVGALDWAAQPRSLAQTDVYVSIQQSWTVFRQANQHDLHALMVEQLANVDAASSFVWFRAKVSADSGAAPRDVMVILGNEAGLAQLGPFCRALVIYDMARLVGVNEAALVRPDGPAATWRACGAQNWTRFQDMPARG